MVSAHWLTDRDTRLATTARPELIYDFGGFPAPLYEVQYPAPGAPLQAQAAARQLAPRVVGQDPARGLDHGAWTVLKHLYPAADVPVFQLSIDITREGAFHVAMGRALSALRAEGVMVVGSGNVVHNLRILDRDAGETDRAQRHLGPGLRRGGVKAAMDAGDTNALSRWEGLSAGARTAVPFPRPLLPHALRAGRGADRREAAPCVRRLSRRHAVDALRAVGAETGPAGGAMLTG